MPFDYVSDDFNSFLEGFYLTYTALSVIYCQVNPLWS